MGLWILLKHSHYLRCCWGVWVMNCEDPAVFCVADDISVLCMHLSLCSTSPGQVLAGLGAVKSSNHSCHPSMTYCVPGVLPCAMFASRCDSHALFLRAYIICFFRSCVTVSGLIFFSCLLNDLIKWVLSALENQSAYLQDSVLLQHYTYILPFQSRSSLWIGNVNIAVTV